MTIFHPSSMNAPATASAPAVQPRPAHRPEREPERQHYFIRFTCAHKQYLNGEHCLETEGWVVLALSYRLHTDEAMKKMLAGIADDLAKDGYIDPIIHPDCISLI